MRTLALYSPLPPEECSARIQAITNRGIVLFSPASRALLHGEVSPRRLAVKMPPHGNPFQPELWASLAEEGSGTTIRGVFRLTPSAWIFPLAGSGAIARSAVTGDYRLAAVLLAGVLLSLFAGRAVSEGEPGLITDILKKTLDAREAHPEDCA